MCYSFHCICKNKEKFTSFPTLFYQCTYVAFANLKVATGGGEKKWNALHLSSQFITLLHFRD